MMINLYSYVFSILVWEIMQDITGPGNHTHVYLEIVYDLDDAICQLDFSRVFLKLEYK